MKRIHFARGPYQPGRCDFAWCNRWTRQLTAEIGEVTCPRCIKRYIDQEDERSQAAPAPQEGESNG